MSQQTDSNSSGSGMDRRIEKKSWPPKRLGLIAGVVTVIFLFIYSFVIWDSPSSLNVSRQKVIINTVREGDFQEFMQINGTVQPIQTIYLDAIEGGVVEDIFKESGEMVAKGDTLLTLSNSDLRLSVLRQTSSLYDQINQTRNSRLNIEQNSLNLKERLAAAQKQLQITKASFKRQKRLFNKDVIAEQTFLETKEDFKYQQKRYELIYESYRQDSVKASRQLRQIDNSLERMWKSLQAVQHILDRLTVTAPISGQLSTIELNPGQSIASGERIGQVDILDNYKIRVGIDEYYLSRIVPGLQGTFKFDGQTRQVEIAKIYPVVENGEFQVDMEFLEEVPSGLTRGQTVRIRLELGDSSPALLIDRGGFYQSSGGDWVFKVSPDGEKAVRQEVLLGRDNPEYFEVVSGLKAGDKVITSGYETFGKNEVLELK